MSNPIDIDNLAMLKEVIGDDLKDILQSFVDIAPGTVELIQQAINEDNAADLRLHAHTLKGSAANIGGVNLPDLSLKLENAGKEGQTTGLDAELAAVIDETQSVLSFLNQYIATEFA